MSKDKKPSINTTSGRKKPQMEKVKEEISQSTNVINICNKEECITKEIIRLTLALDNADLENMRLKDLYNLSLKNTSEKHNELTAIKSKWWYKLFN